MTLGFLVLLLAVAVLLTVCSAIMVKRLADNTSRYPYVMKPALFTPAERSFLGVLDQLLGSDYRIMGKVRIADVVDVGQCDSPGARQTAFNRISSKHFDFILCNKETLSPIAALELDDKSHTAKQRLERDQLVEGICSATGLMLIRMPARHAYTRSDLERLVVTRLQSQAHTPQEQQSKPAVAPNIAGPTGVPASSLKAPAQTANARVPQCPKCAGDMVLRQVKKGARTGERLWGCKLYPKCRGVAPVRGAHLMGASAATADVAPASASKG
jgi:hypothetical protein